MVSNNIKEIYNGNISIVNKNNNQQTNNSKIIEANFTSYPEIEQHINDINIYIHIYIYYLFFS